MRRVPTTVAKHAGPIAAAVRLTARTVTRA